MTEPSREHFLTLHGSLIRDPIPVGDGPLKCRICGETLTKESEAKASCKKCGREHGFMLINGKIRYGVCL